VRDYRAWHKDYDDPQSSLSQRLAVVQGRLDERLSSMPPGPIRVISICAGQGRDVIPVLRDHPRRTDVEAVLLELDPENVAVARSAGASAGLDRVAVVEADASSSDVYAPYVPADIVLACGIFGNISDSDLEGTVRNLSMLCRSGASVIWTRHWKEPEIIDKVRQWFMASGFEDLGYEALENERKMGIGVARLTGKPKPFTPGYRFFTFVR
jgi:hypothetical protein